MSDLDPRDVARYNRDRARYPLFADDPQICPPPRTRDEAATRRDWYRVRVCRQIEVWAALRTFRVNNLGWEYAADALGSLLRRRGIEPPMPPATWARLVFEEV